MNADLRCLHIQITGYVQGVCFRYCTQQEANRLGINGWVRNLSNGSVEVFICGAKSQIARMQAWLTHGPDNAQITHCETTEQKEIEPLSGFTIRY